MCIAWLQALSRQAASGSMIKAEESTPACKHPSPEPSLPRTQPCALPETPKVSSPFTRGWPGRDALLLGVKFLSCGAVIFEVRVALLPLPSSMKSRDWLKTGLGSSHLVLGSPEASDPPLINLEPLVGLWIYLHDRPFWELVKSAGQLICCRGFHEQFDTYCTYWFRCKCFVIMKVLV